MIHRITNNSIKYFMGNKFSTTNYSEQKRVIMKTLFRLFDNVFHKMTISKTFRLFPSYFKKETVTEMLKSQYIDEYCQHISSGRFVKKIKNEQDKQLVQLRDKLYLETEQQVRVLQVYINYIKRTQDLSENQVLMQILDIRNPENWFRTADKGQRKFIYNHGPTNSGKTFNAINELKNLKDTQKGIYMAPLRLLAWQTQQKLGKCNLITGQQKDFQNSHLTSCTIQAINLNEFYDLAIIDEIQMIGDENRGWSWTTPLIGIKADKVHLCGDERALHLVSRILAKSQSSLQQKKYVRLSKLQLLKNDFQFDDLKPGDCIIDFSYKKLYEHRAKINKNKGTSDSPNKTAIIYGKMPPICRKIQAQKFNNGQLPYLVASDAIGMGLNLNIRRIIFVNIMKKSNDGTTKYLQDHAIRQIAGRAGRGYGQGYVQCLNYKIRQRIKKALKSVNVTLEENKEQNITQNMEAQPQKEANMLTQPAIQVKTQNPCSKIASNDENSQFYDSFLKRQLKQDQRRIQKAGIFFPLPIVQRIKIKMQRLLNRNLRTSQTIRLIINLSKQNKQLYFVESNRELLQLSDSLESLGLPFFTHFRFANVPLPSNSKMIKQWMINYAWEYKNKGIVNIPEKIEAQYQNRFEQYKQSKHISVLQEYYLTLECYTWLWNNFQLNFPYNEKGNEIKQFICQKIIQILSKNQQNQKDPIPKQIEQVTLIKPVLNEA